MEHYNKLLSEFLGLEISGEEVWFRGVQMEPKFNSSVEWQQAVFNKIYNLTYTCKEKRNEGKSYPIVYLLCEYFHQNYDNKGKLWITNIKIDNYYGELPIWNSYNGCSRVSYLDARYQALCEFIEWYQQIK